MRALRLWPPTSQQVRSHTCFVRLASTTTSATAPSAGWCSPKDAPTEGAKGAPASVFAGSSHLPPLPVTPLANVMGQLKDSISPLAMNSTELVQTLDLIDKFTKIAGPQLEQLLLNKANSTSNWLTHDWWIRHTYLRSRHPLVINSNPAMIYPSLPFEVNSRQALVRVASLIVSGAIDFKLALIGGCNPEASSAHNEYHLDPTLCYDQYRHFFGSTRIPGQPIDSIKLAPLPPTDLSQMHSMSVVISHKGRFYEVTLTDVDNEQGRIEQLSNVIGKIYEIGTQCSAEGQPILGVGVLTAAKRDDWAAAYELLDQDSMQAIQDAQMVVCLDTIESTTGGLDSDSAGNGSHPSQLRHKSSEDGLANRMAQTLLKSQNGDESHTEALTRQVLHADEDNIANRWFDKTLQLIVVADGKAERLLGAGVNYEHTIAEGMVAAKLIEHSYDKTVHKHREMSQANNHLYHKQSIGVATSGSQSGQSAQFRELRMLARPEDDGELVNEFITRAHRDYLAQIHQFELKYLRYEKYGSDAIKSWRLSPDSFVQVALQLAYFRLHGRLGPCYESGSTRKFAFGRTETIRSLTGEVAEFCRYPSTDTMRSAVESHKRIARLANSGHGLDRTLLGYKLAFDELRSNKWPWPSQNHDTNINIMDINGNYENQNQQATSGQSSPGSEFDDRTTRLLCAFFRNELIRRASQFALSTSQVTSLHPNCVMAYGPLRLDGYGCCYNLTSRSIAAAITANSSNQSFSSEASCLHDHLRESLDYMQHLAKG